MVHWVSISLGSLFDFTLYDICMILLAFLTLSLARRNSILEGLSFNYPRLIKIAVLKSDGGGGGGDDDDDGKLETSGYLVWWHLLLVFVCQVLFL